MKRTLTLMSVLVLAVGCGQSEEPTTDDAAEAAPAESEAASEREIRRERQSEPVEQLPRRDEVDPAKKIPRLQGDAEAEGFGLTMVVDGSTPEAFQESLELIAMDTTNDQYRQLDSALRYLGTYDPAAWSGMASLYESLDGLTGEEIIERASEMRAERNRR